MTKHQKAPITTRAEGSREPVHADEEKQQADSLNLSPERINQGVSTRTEVLTRILERDTRTFTIRNFGINE